MFYYLPSSFRTYIDFVRTGLRILVGFILRGFHKKTVNTCFTCLVALTSLLRLRDRITKM